MSVEEDYHLPAEEDKGGASAEGTLPLPGTCFYTTCCCRLLTAIVNTHAARCGRHVCRVERGMVIRRGGLPANSRGGPRWRPGGSRSAITGYKPYCRLPSPIHMQLDAATMYDELKEDWSDFYEEDYPPPVEEDQGGTWRMPP
ncbi:hypothetical protein QYE76_067962 [Lolium multiflorum]|uniref:Uncharacterized protein n=1 Tax=Lolium multiflorum TaxID=4521 RepID=A0AAD8SFE7_LOLMU|nr:hypothetical protein QYE76_067962 [Lolium multiflorum]